MKMLFLSALLLFYCPAALADNRHELAITDSAYDKTTSDITDEMVADLAEAEKWCDQPRPKLEKGETAIIWSRDASGRCTKQTLVHTE